jgi:hypothetical protein
MVTGKRPWECALASVTGLVEVDRDPATLAGGVRKRLGIQTPDGTEIFVINQLNNKANAIRELLDLST